VLRTPDEESVVVLVLHIMDAARKRLAVLSRDASVFDAAEILANPAIPVVVVCDEAGATVGVISRTDILKTIAGKRSAALDTNASAMMTQAILSCHANQTVQQVWGMLNARSLRCAPILDGDGRPLGVIHARDLARALLDEVAQEEELLRDYFLGIGYQ
jgi:CBS domain-containing protein